jgi:hypothetical protein
MLPNTLTCCIRRCRPPGNPSIGARGFGPYKQAVAAVKEAAGRRCNQATHTPMPCQSAAQHTTSLSWLAPCC